MFKESEIEVSHKYIGKKIKTTMLHKPTGRWVECVSEDMPGEDARVKLTRKLEREVAFAEMGI